MYRFIKILYHRQLGQEIQKNTGFCDNDILPYFKEPI